MDLFNIVCALIEPVTSMDCSMDCLAWIGDILPIYNLYSIARKKIYFEYGITFYETILDTIRELEYKNC